MWELLCAAAIMASAFAAHAQWVIELRDLHADDSGFRIVAAYPFDATGWALGGGGDFNGDGINDLIIGSPRHGSGGSATVVYGRAVTPTGVWLRRLPGAFGVSLLGEHPIDRVGGKIAGPGDVNGDGFDDVLVGRRLRFDPPAWPVSYLWYGRPGMPAGTSTPDTMTLDAIDGTAGVGFFQSDVVAREGDRGHSVAALGDLNQDGFGDLVISSFGPDEHPTAVYVVFGSGGFPALVDLDSLDGTNGFKLPGVPGSGGVFGGTGLGDINGDGIPDVGLSTRAILPFAGSPGACAVVYGRSDSYPPTLAVTALPPDAGFLVYGGTSGESFCADIESAGDFNDDGVDDFVIGNFPSLRVREPRAVVVFGRAGGFPELLNVDELSNTERTVFRRQSPNGTHTLFVGNDAGDLNGDDVDDLVFGVPSAEFEGFTVGETYLVFGPASRYANSGGTIDLATGFAGVVLRGGTGVQDGITSGDYAGAQVTITDDISGDGLADILIGADFAPQGGYAAVVLSNRAPSSTSETAMLPSQPEDSASPGGAFVDVTFIANYADEDPLAGVAVVANSASLEQGRWQYRALGNDWADIPTSVSDEAAVVARLDWKLRFLAAPDFFGQPGPLVVRLWDGRWLSPGENIDISEAIGSLGGVSRNTDLVSLGVSVNPINDPPSFVARNPPVALSDEPVAIDRWATFFAGAANEAQSAQFQVTDVSRPDLFQQPLTVAPDGTLTYQAIANALGESAFTVTVTDDGGTDHGGSNTSLPASFLLQFDQIVFANGFENEPVRRR